MTGLLGCLLQEAARLLRDRALDGLKAAAVAQAEAARLRAQLMLSHPAHGGAHTAAQVCFTCPLQYVALQASTACYPAQPLYIACLMPVLCE